MDSNTFKIPPLCENARAWHDGTCCCNCANQRKLMSHPWNQKFGKGACTEVCGWVCIIQDEPELEIDEPVYQFFDKEHGFCELHVPTKECKQALNATRRALDANLIE